MYLGRKCLPHASTAPLNSNHLSANMAEEMAAEAPPTAGSGIVRQLPASAEYLPTEEQTADMEFLAMVAQGASRNDEIVAAIDAGQYINVADIRGNTIMHLILQRGPHQVGCLGGRHHLPESNSLSPNPENGPGPDHHRTRAGGLCEADAQQGRRHRLQE